MVSVSVLAPVSGRRSNGGIKPDLSGAHPNDFSLGGDALDMLRERAAWRRALSRASESSNRQCRRRGYRLGRRATTCGTTTRRCCWPLASRWVAVAERLGHENATLVLTTYGHLLPDSEDRTRRAVDDAWISDGPGTDGGDHPQTSFLVSN
jgi:hypothetical protein